MYVCMYDVCMYVHDMHMNECITFMYEMYVLNSTS
jgi:hypothetical protein